MIMNVFCSQYLSILERLVRPSAVDTFLFFCLMESCVSAPGRSQLLCRRAHTVVCYT